MAKVLNMNNLIEIIANIAVIAGIVYTASANF